jgi:hypothetical protein
MYFVCHYVHLWSGLIISFVNLKIFPFDQSKWDETHLAIMQSFEE